MKASANFHQICQKFLLYLTNYDGLDHRKGLAMKVHPKYIKKGVIQNAISQIANFIA